LELLYIGIRLGRGAWAGLGRSGNLDEALGHARRAAELGRRYGDRDLEMLGLHNEGCILVTKGQVDDGMRLVDEATASAVAGELGPLATAIVYCNTISTCRDLVDVGRASDWTEAAGRWCERQAITGYPGICRVHRAEVLRLRGAWSAAEDEARRACEELKDFSLPAAGEGFNEIGEIRLRMGDQQGAEEAFQQAHELGRDPVPGLALLQLERGNADAAAGLIARALKDKSWKRLHRARLLPAQAEIALARGDLETANAAASELVEIARVYGTPALEASAASTRASVLLAEDEPGAALEEASRARRLWQELDLPYELARSRMLIASAHRELGDEAAAALEITTSKAVFERLGAAPEAKRAASLLDVGRAAPPRAERAFMFTDICSSTNLLQAIGDEAWHNLVEWHDQTLRSLFSRHGGEEVDHAGDGFFVAFAGSAEALGCAQAIQQTLAEHRRAHGFAPQVRIGVHAAEANRDGAGYRGKGVHEAARIGALAQAGEILASRPTLESAGIEGSEARPVELKGIAEPVEVARLDWA
jgi:class 3 adenylate cyclase